MTALTELQVVKDDFELIDSSYAINDRGQMYIRVHTLTNGSSAVVEGNISTFSGFVGGTAYLANYILADKSQNGNANYSYDMNDIYVMSQLVATDYIEGVINDYNSSDGNQGNITIGNGIIAARNTWGAQNLPDQFPGNIFETITLDETRSLTLPLGFWRPGGSDGEKASLAGAVGSILFGKSIEDFQGREGYAILNNTTPNNADFYNMPRYVLRYDPGVGGGEFPNGDRNEDGILNYDDGIVAMIETTPFNVVSPLWETNVEAMLGVASLFFRDIPKDHIDLDWSAYRDWQLMKDFRAQLVEGGEYDFVEYAKINGVGTEKDFWNYAENLLGDVYGRVRNIVYHYDRNQEGAELNDYLYGGGGKDILKGNAGDDVIRSGWNDDAIDGGEGDDHLYGEFGKDTFVGGEGNDIIFGGAGTDTVDYSADPAGITIRYVTAAKTGTVTDGWGSVDTLYSIENFILTPFDDVVEFYPDQLYTSVIDGGDGTDTVRYLAGASWYYDPARQDVYSDVGLERRHDLQNVEDVVFSGTARATVLLDGVIDYELTGIRYTNTFSGGGHYGEYYDFSAATTNMVMDLSIVSASNTTGSGSNITYRASRLITAEVQIGDRTYSGVLDDSLVQVDGFDFQGRITNINITGTDYGDTVRIDEGASRSYQFITFHSGAGDDTVELGVGNYYYKAGFDDITVFQGSIWLPQFSVNYEDLFFSVVDTDTLVVNVGTLGELRVEGWINSAFSSQNKIYHGNAVVSYDILAGQFVTTGPVWNDNPPPEVAPDGMEYVGTPGDDYFEAAATGNIGIRGYLGNDELYGNSGDNIVEGGPGNDFLGGGDGDDTVYGGLDDDSVYGDAGINTLYGGLGDDYYLIRTSAVNTIQDEGDDADDTIGIIDDEGTLLQSFYEIAGSDLRLYGPGGALFATIVDYQLIEMYSSFAFGEGDDVFKDTEGFLSLLSPAQFYEDEDNNVSPSPESTDTTYFLLGGNDTFNGNSADDVVYAGEGNDSLNGGAGDDVLSGGEGDDYLKGADGHDTLQGDAGDDIVTGNDGDDILYGHDGLNGLSGGAGDDTLYGGSGWDILFGDDGDDVIHGGAGDDNLNGGDGNDVLNGGAGSDTLEGGAGRDTFLYDESAFSVEGAIDYIVGFETGEGGDVLNIANILDFNSESDDQLADFIMLQQSGGTHTRVLVDVDGAGEGHGWTAVAQIQNVTGLTLENLIANGNLIAE